MTVIIWIYHLPFIDWRFGVFPTAKIFKTQWILISGEFWTACLLQLDWLFMRLGQSVKIHGTFLIGVIWTARSFGEIVMSVSQTATEYEAIVVMFGQSWRRARPYIFANRDRDIQPNEDGRIRPSWVSTYRARKRERNAKSETGWGIRSRILESRSR